MSEVIIVSQDQQFRDKCAHLLSEEELPYEFATSEADLQRQLRSRRVGLVILKSGHDESDCRPLLDMLKGQHPKVSVILSTEYFSFWSDFSTWAADACVVDSKDMQELRTKVHELAGVTKAQADEAEAFLVDWA
jgi:DNA-binding NtrC family response regulator